MYSYRSNKLLLNNFNVGIRQWILKKENLNFAYFKKGVAVNLKNSRMGGSKLPANQTAPCVIHAKAWLFSIFVIFFTAWKLHFASSTEKQKTEAEKKPIQNYMDSDKISPPPPSLRTLVKETVSQDFWPLFIWSSNSNWVPYEQEKIISWNLLK